ncbi:HAMP domain-containing sensor histidine kinase [Piscinibacter sp. HJYY11]|uniref:sensor histidine kinase n=1 Tax=Piscinibacter sp. HJYY11 TaxID=2801333 RepID=UPI00191E6E03|nr:HAMP domain-containing sensor histidine kinase [Piscinibacter sp. HJYY11]MBL0729972.1 HAMP domain-containing histidine kinase [Piscinibacter sp. HJYY11]
MTALKAPGKQVAFSPAPNTGGLTDEVEWLDRGFWILPRLTALYLALAFLLVPWYWPSLPTAERIAWVVGLAVFIGARLAIIRALKAWRARPDRQARDSQPLWFLLATVTGLYWGFNGWLLYGHGSAIETLLLGFVLYGLCMLNAFHTVAAFRAFEVNCLLLIGPLLVRIALPGRLSDLMAALFVLGVVGGTTFIARHHLLQLRRFGGVVMTQLRREKELAEEARHVADAARHEAEVANRAKTQFFAAASHDLRQPLHAMGLLSEALSQRSQDRALAPLVASLHSSVGALEDLFSELLDVTKIDGGAVTVSPEDFEVREVFRKLRLHFEPVAFDKGLSLRFRGAACRVHADPVLVERILRNLVANAIRYTPDGGVLVGCRRRGGRVQLQVWDTGVGIPEHERERVFEEFYQVPDVQQAPGPQDRKGLGLGLSIAQRLSALMGASLTLRSQPGRGSVFTLELPAAAPLSASLAA